MLFPACRSIAAVLIAAALFCSILLAPTIAVSETTDIEISSISVATGIDRDARAPLNSAESFPPDCGNLFCFTRIRGAVGTTNVTHVWYRDGEVMARVVLPVRSGDWRTWSSKMILPVWTGNWEVKVLDSLGVVLASEEFAIEARTSAAEGGEGETQ